MIAESLTVIFNKSIETGIFPDDLKVSCISLIHKAYIKEKAKQNVVSTDQYLLYL